MGLYDDKAPGVYIEELAGGARPIQAVGTSTAGFLGVAPDPSKNVLEPKAINNWTEFKKYFCPPGSPFNPGPKYTGQHLARAVYGFFQNKGSRCYVVNLGDAGDLADGLAALARVDEVAIVAAPGYCAPTDYDALISHCQDLKYRVAILDAPQDVSDLDLLKVAGLSQPPGFTVSTDNLDDVPDGVKAEKDGEKLKLSGTGNPGDTVKALDADKKVLGQVTVGADQKWVLPSFAFPQKDAQIFLEQSGGGLKPPQTPYAAFYYPWIQVRDPLLPRGKDGSEPTLWAPPSGHIAGIWARSDSTRGVHKAPANEPILGALGVKKRLIDAEQGGLNQAGVNCIRAFAREGIVVWGARTLAPDGEWRYLNVRRLFNMIENSIVQSTRWIVFEPNDEALWKAIRRDVTAFLTRIWRTGALMGSTAEQSFFVKCDAETNPPEEIDAGKVTIVIGIAPVKPAEFVVFQISQLVAGAQVSESGG